MLYETGFNSSPVTKRVLLRAVKPPCANLGKKGGPNDGQEEPVKGLDWNGEIRKTRTLVRMFAVIGVSENKT